MKANHAAGKAAALIVSLFIGLRTADVQAKLVINCWDETKKAHYLRRRISTAINIYAKEGTTPQVKHETGMLEGVEYDVLRVDPGENTFLKVDYSESPKYLDLLYDSSLVKRGYVRVGGINAGYFDNTPNHYGRPVGAVRVNNEWTTWHGQLNTPAFGSGYATAYFNTSDLKLRYHGWKDRKWQGDPDWSWWTGYLIEAENAVSGSYTYFADGQEKDITGGETAGINYHRYGRALTIFAQNENEQFLLIEFYGTMREEAVRQFLRDNHVTDAIRMDGGGSCQMIYEEELVNLDYTPEAISHPDPPLFDRGAIAKRRLDAALDRAER